MPHRGFETPPAAHIRLIRDNLHDRYGSGFPIIKEIIQNADDATGATCLHFGWCPGFPNDKHPLLQGPAIFFVNDGGFTREDEKAIRLFGLGYKAAERASVGKFGLGLKSVFHLCEAYFYLWCPPHNEGGAAISGSILNPWSGWKHSDWDEVTDSSLETIREFLKPLLPTERWFCLWLPLRRHDAIDGVAPIVKTYPGDNPAPPSLEAAFCDDLASQLAHVLPQLHCVRTLWGWISPSATQPLEKQFTINLTELSHQRRFPDVIENGPTPLSGQIEVTWHQANTATTLTHAYAGFETLTESRELRGLLDSQYWPTDTSEDPDSAESTEIPEKAAPHGLVSFVSSPSGSVQSARFKITWAVFLPVGAGIEELAIDSGMDVQLTLHGYFFLDAGRQRIEGISEEEPTGIRDETSLRHAWNARLRRKVVLPLLLPAFEAWVRKSKAPETAVLAVTSALSKSQIYRKHRQEITEKAQWIRRVRPSSIQWELVDSATRVLEIAAPPQAELDRPFSVFPALDELAETYALIHRNSPFLATGGPSQWPGGLIATLITSVPAGEIFASRTYLSYFAEALVIFQIQDHHEAMKKVASLLRTAFREVPVSDLRANAAAIRNVIGLLPPEWFFPFPDFVPQDIHRFLAGLELDRVPVSKHFFTGNGALETRDLARILDALADPPEVFKQRPDWPKLCSELAVLALNVHGDSALVMAEPYVHSRLFRVKDCQRGTEVLESAAAIVQAFERRTAFAFGALPTPEGQANALQKALSDRRILLVPAETYDTLLGGERRPCNATACWAVLETKPLLRDSVERAELLSALLGAHQDGLAKALRYLLHGRPEHYDDEGLLIAANFAEGEDVWTKLVRLVVEPWRHVPRELANALNPEQRRALGITAISRDGVVQLLRESMESLCTLDLTTLSATEREQLLEQITDNELLKRLPLHETLSGNLISVGPNTYLDTGLRPGTALGTQLQIVARLRNNRLAIVQEELLDSLTPVKLLELALGQSHPVKYWQDIAMALAETRAHELEPFGEQLRKRAWMPLRAGGGIAPESILELKGLETVAGRLVFPNDGDCIPAYAILDGCWTDPGVQRHKDRLLPPFPVRLDMLGEILAGQKVEEFCCGFSSFDEIRLRELVDFFAGTGVMPIADIVRTILEQYPNAAGQICQNLLSHLGQAPSTNKLVRIVSHLANGHTNAGFEEEDKWKRWHDRYLEIIRQSTDMDQILPKIRLRNRAGQWKTTTELCVGAENVRDEDLLEPRQAELLGLAIEHVKHREALHEVGQAAPQVEINENALDWSAEALRSYFSPWRSRVPEELVGAFLAFLGDHAGIQALAQEYLGQRSVRMTRDLLQCSEMIGVGVGRDEDVHTAMSKQRFLVSIVEGDTVDVTSIAGVSFKARLRQDADSIFVGATFKNVWSLDQERSTYRITRLDLRNIDVEKMESDNTLSVILRNSLQRLVYSVYRRSIPSLDDFWMDLAKSEQLDIEIARNMLLESAFFYVGQLGIPKQLPQLRNVVSRYDQIRKQIAEEEHAAARFGRNVWDNERANALREVKREFVERLESDREVQALFLEAIRKKIGDHYQYSLHSVPFELFQNADDATVELNEMLTAAGLPPQQEAFLVAWEDNALTFMHWGRPINKFRESGFEQGQERGFDRDLERMLVLNASDKSVFGDGASVTGKFGLGFKSVFLICDRPKIRSGRLGFEILGGMWPKAVPAEDLLEQLRNARPSLRNGTIITIGNMREPATRDTIIQRFQQLAGILLAFSRKIKSIELRPRDASPQRIEWREETLNDSRTLAVAQIGLPPEMARSHVLKILAAQGSLLFKMNGDGFARLPDCVPTIWVTAPTEETSDLGFAINGPFPLDVGRAKLGRDSREYRTLAHAIGAELGKYLCELYDRSRADWAGLSRSLGLLHNLDEYQFWESFWILCVAPFGVGNRDQGNEAFALVREVMWSAPDRGGSHLLRDRAAVPTGLWGAYRTLTRSGDIASAVLGVLDEESMFAQVSRWEAAAILLTPGRTVSVSRYRALTQLKMIEPKEVEKVSLRTILETDVHEGTCIAPMKAIEFGAVFTREFLQDLERGSAAQKEERNSLLDLLTTYRFRAQDGSVQSAQDLLTSHANGTDPSDEGLRAAFAPANLVLNEDYSDSDAARAFFLACRPRMHAPVDRLKVWAIVAATPDKRGAVLMYLLKGELGRDLGHELREAKTGTWFETRQQIESFCDLSPHDIHEICGLLGIYPPELTPVMPTPVPAIDPAVALKQVLNWWLSVKDEKTIEYDQQIYPDGMIDFLSTDYDNEDEGQRRSWFTLFLLGMTHTIGRSRPAQHRSFVNRCAQNRWLDVFVARDSSAENWIRILDEYIDHPIDSSEFSHWMKLFPNIYRVAKYLDEYIGAFLHVDFMNRPFALTEVTNLHQSLAFQGGGYDAPDLGRTLGIGACFVMRELVRRQVLCTPHAHQHCFTPTKRIRDIFQTLGCADLTDVEPGRNAIRIYNFVVKHLGEQQATFSLSFDVPFYFLAESLELQQELLGRMLTVVDGEPE